MPSGPVTALLARWRGGDPGALEALVPLVYEELHRIAHRYLRRERADHTLQSTALVHEAYLRLVAQAPTDTRDRQHFVAIAARLMRQILVDYARSHQAVKRGAACRVEVDAALGVPEEKGTDVVALDDALNELARLDERQSKIVELRYFGGMTNDEAAEVLGISPATVKRDWNVAKAWLSRQIRRGPSGGPENVGKN